MKNGKTNPSYIDILTKIEKANKYKIRFEAIIQPDQLRDNIFVHLVDKPDRTAQFYIYPTLDSKKEIINLANMAVEKLLKGENNGQKNNR